MNNYLTIRQIRECLLSAVAYCEEQYDTSCGMIDELDIDDKLLNDYSGKLQAVDIYNELRTFINSKTGRPVEYTYTHPSGIEFDLGLIEGHDITTIMLYDFPDDTMDDGFYIVDHLWGPPSDQDDRDVERITTAWLASKPDGYIEEVVRRQLKYQK